MWTIVLGIAALVIILAACAWFAWNYGDYIIEAWSWVLAAFNALLTGVPDWAFPIFGAIALIAFIGILIKIL